MFSSLSSSSNQNQVLVIRCSLVGGHFHFRPSVARRFGKTKGIQSNFETCYYVSFLQRDGSRLRTRYVRTFLGTFQYFHRLNGKFVEDTRIFVSYLGLLRKPVDWTIYFHVPYSTCICVKANNRLAQPAIPAVRTPHRPTNPKKKSHPPSDFLPERRVAFFAGGPSLSHLSSNNATKLALEITNK